MRSHFPCSQPARLQRWSYALIISVLPVLTAGCSGPTTPLRSVAPVIGTITYSGKPVAAAVVILSQLDNPERPTSVTTMTDENGHFEPIMLSGKGLPPGDYLVAVTPKLLSSGGIAAKKFEKRSDIPARYRDEQNSPLRIEVVKDQENVFELSLN